MVNTIVKVERGRRVRLPDEVIDRLGIDIGDDVEIRVEKGVLTIRPVASSTQANDVVSHLAGIFRAYATIPPPSPEEEERMIAEAIVREVMEEMEEMERNA